MKNNVYILYGSQSGNAEEIAQNIYTLLCDNNIECKYSSLNKTIKGDSFDYVKDEATIETINKIIIVCSTTGNGDAPENANHF